MTLPITSDRPIAYCPWIAQYPLLPYARSHLTRSIYKLKLQHTRFLRLLFQHEFPNPHTKYAQAHAVPGSEFHRKRLDPHDESSRNKSTITLKNDIIAALHRTQWFKIDEKLIRFTENGPQLIYPPLENKVKHFCKQCEKSESFFLLLSKEYTNMVQKMMDQCDHTIHVIKPFCREMLLFAERYKRHEISEFARYVLLDLGESEFRGNKEYSKELSRWMNLKTYLKIINNRQWKMQLGYYLKLRETSGLLRCKSYRQLEEHIREGNDLLSQCEKRIEELTLIDRKRWLEEESEFIKERLKSKEQYFVYRISNAAMMTEWLNDKISQLIVFNEEDINYMFTAFRKTQLNRRNQWPLSSLQVPKKMPLKYCNIRCRRRNTIFSGLPPSKAHFNAFTVGPQINQIHSSWYKNLMGCSEVNEEILRFQKRNLEVERNIRFIETDIQRIETTKHLEAFFRNQFSRNGCMQMQL